MASKSIRQGRATPTLPPAKIAATVIDMAECKSRDTVATFRDLLERALSGRLRGFAFVYKTTRARHCIGLTGDYLDDPSQALAGASRMQYKANQLMSARADDPDTETMPL